MEPEPIISVADPLCRSACPPDMRRQAGDPLLALAAVLCRRQQYQGRGELARADSG